MPDDPLDDREQYAESVQLCKKCSTRMVEVEAWDVFGSVSPIPQCPECGWNEWNEKLNADEEAAALKK